MPAVISTFRACATWSSEAARYTRFTTGGLSKRSQEGPHVLAALQCFDQGGADHDAVHMRRKASHLLMRADPESRTYGNLREALDPIHVIEHLVGHFGRLAGDARHGDRV